MISVSATEFVQNFGHYKEEAQRAPVAITSYGRVSGYFVSATDYERMRATSRNVYDIADMPEELFGPACI
jgi:prevent-host-death family protein